MVVCFGPVSTSTAASLGPKLDVSSPLKLDGLWRQWAAAAVSSPFRLVFLSARSHVNSLPAGQHYLLLPGRTRAKTSARAKNVASECWNSIIEIDSLRTIRVARHQTGVILPAAAALLSPAPAQPSPGSISNEVAAEQATFICARARAANSN